MAKKTPKPARTLLIFVVVVAAMYALVAFTAPAQKGSSVWKPTLGLDLEGGTRITLTASKTPTAEQLALAKTIINQRASGSGVSEADVSTQGSRNIVVEIPSKNPNTNLVDAVQRTAQLRFRLIASVAGGGNVAPGASSSGSASPDAGLTPSASASPAPSPTASGANRPAPFAQKAPAADPTASPTASPSEGSSATANPSALPSSGASAPAGATTKGASVNDPVAWQQNPGSKWLSRFAAYKCPKNGDVVPKDDPDKPLVTCDDKGSKFLLSKAVIEGTSLKTASFGNPQNSAAWAVNLTLKGPAVKTFADISRQLLANNGQFATVLDGRVVSYAGFNGVIPNGQAQITGSFTQAEAKSLSESLKFGALPVKFDRPAAQTIGPSLAGNQLSAGILAGVVGLLLVMLYCLLYYRGLGLVVIASLVVAGAVTYGAVLILAKTAGFTLTLPGIAGLIVAVGITADSFIVYFERIRDEMRSGKSMRVAVELGWARARNTCLAADAVSLLAAVVLYIFTIGVVKGFAFTLGVSTLIDLAVFFWFTKPTMTGLARVKFFSSGNRFSGLSHESLGIDRPPTTPSPATTTAAAGRA